MILLLLAACDADSVHDSATDDTEAPDTDGSDTDGSDTDGSDTDGSDTDGPDGDTSDTDSGEDSAGLPDDTGDSSSRDSASDSTADSGDTTTPPGPPRWDASFFGGADLTVTQCGTEDDGPYALAPGPDLDGDGLPELAVGAPGAEGAAVNTGTVYLLRGADLAASPSVFDAWARVESPLGTRSGGFGAALQWVGDRDGDGVEDLLVRAEYGSFRDEAGWIVSGADLAAGGDIVVSSIEMDEEEAVYARWDDLDGDGVDDWILGMPNRGMGSYGTRGALGAVLDGDFGVAGTPTRLREVYGEAAAAHAGATLAVLDGDYDGDGIREVAASLDGDTVVVNSGALLDWATYVDELVRWRFTGMDASDYTVLLALGDVDGGGRDDLLFLDPGAYLCVGRGEDADETGGTTTCFDDTDLGVPWNVALGGDLDGDGLAEVWGRREDALVAWDVADLFAGTVTERARGAVGEASTDDALVVADGQVWTSTPVYGRVEQDAVWAFPEADGLTMADADVVVTGGGWGGSPSSPAWVDATGDGVDDLAFFEDGRLDVFDGTGLPAGGARTVCDAEHRATWDGAYDLDWLGDVNGDGVEDALLTYAGDTETLHRVVSGRVLLGLDAGDDLATWEGERVIPWGGCDLTGDGRVDLVGGYGDTYYDGTLLTSGDPAAALLGSVDREDTYRWCIPDVDGDGGAEIVVPEGTDHAVLLSSQLDPATTLTPADRWILLTDSVETDRWTSPVALGDLDGDGADEHLWLVRLDRSGTVYSLCLLDPAPLSAGGELALADATLDCMGEWEDTSAEQVADVTGDGVDDFVFRGADSPSYDWSFYGIDGAARATITPLEPITATMPDDRYRLQDGDLAADVLGVGAPSLWLRWYHYDVGYEVVEVVYAER